MKSGVGEDESSAEAFHPFLPFGFFGSTNIRKMLRFLHSRWSVEMTGFRSRFVSL